MTDFKKLHDAILTGDLKAAIAATEEALAEKVDPQVLIKDYMVPAMGEAGRRFECEEYFVPELLISARAMKGALPLIGPLLAETTYRAGGTLLYVGDSPKTEYLWFDTWADDTSGRRVAEMRMQLRFMKASSKLYQEAGTAAQAGSQPRAGTPGLPLERA